LDASIKVPLGHFGTEYFGAEGGQGAAFFQDGRVAYIQFAASGPIHRVLALLGVRIVNPAIDEFQSVGLGRQRTAQEW
jgi:hypothetical protein